MQQAETKIFYLTQHKQNNVTMQLNIQIGTIFHLAALMVFAKHFTGSG
jgi:hypothetical protein